MQNIEQKNGKILLTKVCEKSFGEKMNKEYNTYVNYIKPQQM